MCEILPSGYSFNTSSIKSFSLDGAHAGRILKKPKQLNSSLPAAPSSLDNSCVAARIRPICRYRKRRLVRANAVSHLSKKVGVMFHFYDGYWKKAFITLDLVSHTSPKNKRVLRRVLRGMYLLVADRTSLHHQVALVKWTVVSASFCHTQLISLSLEIIFCFSAENICPLFGMWQFRRQRGMPVLGGG